MASSRIKGLYAITPDLADTQHLLLQAEGALQGGAALLQYRNKLADAGLRQVQAAALLPLCRRYAVPLIVNDDLPLALALGADGVHLGGDDGDIAEARRLLGPDRIIGASCYNRLELAVSAKAAGADYVAFGSCFGSSTKPAAVRAPLELFARARAEVGLPAVAIGGLTAENIPLVLQAGADSVAVISELFSAADVRTRAAELVELIVRYPG